MEKDGESIVAAVSVCSPGDIYSKRIGREIAYGRLRKKVDGIERALALIVESNDKVETFIQEFFRRPKEIIVVDGKSKTIPEVPGIDIQKLYGFRNSDISFMNRSFAKAINNCMENE